MSGKVLFLKQGVSGEKLSATIKKPKSSQRKNAAKPKVPFVPIPYIEKPLPAKIYKLLKEGKSRKEIMKELGVTMKCVYDHTQKIKVVDPNLDVVLYGKRNGLTDLQRTILPLMSAGMKDSAIAKLLGKNQCTIFASRTKMKPLTEKPKL